MTTPKSPYGKPRSSSPQSGSKPGKPAYGKPARHTDSGPRAEGGSRAGSGARTGSSGYAGGGARSGSSGYAGGGSRTGSSGYAGGGARAGSETRGEGEARPVRSGGGVRTGGGGGYRGKAASSAPYRETPAFENTRAPEPRREEAEVQGPDLVYGLHAVDAVLRHHHNNVDHLLVQEGRDDSRMEQILERARRVNIRVETVNRSVLDVQAQGVHQGVLAVCRQLHLERSEAQLKELLDGLEHPPFLLVLDGVTDPHNLGACLRSAEAAGIDGVIVPKDKSALLNPTARKVACGAAEVMPFFAVTNLVRTLKTLQEGGIWIYGAAGEATQSIYQTDLRGPVALVMGSEGTGMRRLTRESCDTLFSIPMAGEVSSLNVSVSAGICLFEAVRQRALT